MNVPPVSWTASARRLATKGGWLVGATLVLAWTWGLALFLRRDGSLECTLPDTRKHPLEEHNLAAWNFGPTIRASSYLRDVSAQHHPTFLVDGQRAPTLLEKWASSPDDRHPWVEIRWRGLHEVRRIALQHAGVAEDNGLTARSYRAYCLAKEGVVGPSITVSDNHQARTVHDLACARASGVRLEVEPNGPSDVVRLYELEVWGL